MPIVFGSQSKVNLRSTEDLQTTCIKPEQASKDSGYPSDNQAYILVGRTATLVVQTNVRNNNDQYFTVGCIVPGIFMLVNRTQALAVIDINCLTYFGGI